MTQEETKKIADEILAIRKEMEQVFEKMEKMEL